MVLSKNSPIELEEAQQLEGLADRSWAYDCHSGRCRKGLLRDEAGSPAQEAAAWRISFMKRARPGHQAEVEASLQARLQPS
jgi:hypothetical protein